MDMVYVLVKTKLARKLLETVSNRNLVTQLGAEISDNLVALT